MYKRDIYNTIRERMLEPRQFLQVVMGPRQVGKSTVVVQVLKSLPTPYIYCNADGAPATDIRWIANQWEAARLRMRVENLSEIILTIDEVQKIYNWSEAVKREWDADTFNNVNIKVILLGSSRVMISRGLSESLFGRYEEVRMGHWAYPEMRDAFGLSLEQYIYFGGYPGASGLLRTEKRWKDYISSAVVDATINKDIIIDTPINKPALLRHTFELSAAYSGRILSLTKMLGSLQDAGNTTTLTGYLNLLSDSGLITGLQKYSADLSRRRASIPKYQVFNNALTTVYCESSFKDCIRDHKMWGRLLESAVGAHILNNAFINRFEVYYWREGDCEVDFIIRKQSRVIAIEVKSNDESTSKGLETFRKLFAPTECIIVGSRGISVDYFLSMDLAEL